MSFWRGSTRALRVAFFGLCGAFGGLGIRLISVYLDSTFLAYLAVLVTGFGIAVVFWAAFFVKD
jgi:hypothetical protein